jgi:hypothetical protein
VRREILQIGREHLDGICRKARVVHETSDT